MICNRVHREYLCGGGLRKQRTLHALAGTHTRTLEYALVGTYTYAVEERCLAKSSAVTRPFTYHYPRRWLDNVVAIGAVIFLRSILAKASIP